MQIVIDIPDDKLTQKQSVLDISLDIISGKVFSAGGYSFCILPRNHGRLIDADKLECDGFNRTSDDYAFDCIDNAPTILEADKEKSEEQENDIPWYLKIFNQDILNEYQKRRKRT